MGYRMSSDDDMISQGIGLRERGTIEPQQLVYSGYGS
jgi:hypothetical protein